MLWQRLKASNSLSVALVLVLVLGASSLSHAATISYGNFGPVDGVMFNDVEESSGTDPVPLYGPPDTFSIGLDFDPQGFVSTASGGNEDITDGQVNFTLMGNDVVGIDTIRLTELGDYSLTGVGTSATQALAGAIMRATVTQIDGVNVAPIDLTPVNASVGFNLNANPGIVQPWSLGLSLNVDAQLTSLGRTFRIGATKIEVAINNQLQTLSQVDSQAFIAKKEFRVGVDRNFIPEPSTFALLGVALCGCGLFARRERN
ncbi:MAG TPA: PEP-CTERM sorting domain-containing protein [Lacipirellulaceae bacterium]